MSLQFCHFASPPFGVTGSTTQQHQLTDCLLAVIGSRAVVPSRPGDVLITFGRVVSEEAIMEGSI